MLNKNSILKNAQILMTNSNLYSIKKESIPSQNKTIEKNSTHKYIGPKDFFIQSFLLKNKLLNENDVTKFYDNQKYFERETKFFEKFSDSVDFSGYPLNERLHNKHEFYLNEPKRVHSHYDLRKFEHLIKKEKREKDRMEKLETKKKKMAQKNPIKETVQNKPVIQNQEQQLAEDQEKQAQEMSDNEFKMDENAKKILATIMTKPKKMVSDKKEVTIIKQEELALRDLFERQEIEERQSKIKKYIKFLNKNQIDEKFLLKDVNKFPFLPKEMVLENKTMYTPSEIHLLEKKLFNEPSQFSCDKLMPSVSNIIQLAYPLSENLLKWKIDKAQALSIEGLQTYLEQIKQDGQQFHSYVENRLLNKPTLAFDKNFEALEDVFKNIGTVLLTEAPVRHSNLFYHGRIDCLAYYKNELCLIDWKCSEKSKPDIKDLYDTPVQISAYIGAFLSDPRYEDIRRSHRIKKGLLVNFNKLNGDVNLHFINYQLSEFYWYKWLNYLREFWINVLKNK